MSKDHDAYGAGYRDGSINYELEHCPACKNVADLQEALDENAKLRELIDSVLYLYEQSPKMWEHSYTFWDAWTNKARELMPDVRLEHKNE